MKKKYIISFLFVLAMILFSGKVFGFTVVIDPGHGGTESGAVAQGGELEKDLNLKIARYLCDYLSEYDVTVYMTHDGLSGGELEIFDRAIFAREKKADLVLSIHLNSIEEGTANGAEVWVTANKSLDKYNKNMTEFGNRVLSNLGKLGIGNRGVKTSLRESDWSEVYSDGSKADYFGIICYCMRGCKIDFGVISPAGAVPAKVEAGEGVPAAIIEHCFLRGTDYKFIDSDSDLKKLAEADGKAVVEQFGLKKKKQKGNTPFNDIYIDDWYHDAVKYTYEHNLIKGYNNTTFAPEDNLTRGMLVTILHRMEGEPYVSGVSKFPDVQDTEEYYYVAVKWATQNGIIHGYNNGNFGPEDPITREQLAVMLAHYTQYKGKYKKQTVNLNSFKDANKISSNAIEQITWAVGVRVLEGNSSKYLNPQGNATRADVAAMLYKYCTRVK